MKPSWPVSLIWNRTMKSENSRVVARNSLTLTVSVSDPPVIAPSSTRQIDELPSQPASVFPSNSGVAGPGAGGASP